MPQTEVGMENPANYRADADATPTLRNHCLNEQIKNPGGDGGASGTKSLPGRAGWPYPCYFNPLRLSDRERPQRVAELML